MSRWCLVTGGSRGIGRAVALDLGARGWNVAVAFLQNEQAAAEVGDRLRELGRQVLVHQGNLANSDECARLVQLISSETDALHGLVHAAALGALAPVLETRANRWRLAWDTHVGALVDLVKHGQPLFAREASVVALSSLGARRVTEGYASIAAAKGALESVVRYLAAELAGQGINVNAVCGGPVDTDSLRTFPGYDGLVAESTRRPPGRLGEPSDLAPIVAFLLSPEARWIRGQVIVADGGLSLY